MKKPLYLLSIASILLSSMLPVVADGKTDRLNHVKAAFILNIVRFAEWPNISRQSIEENYRLCFLNNNPLGSAINSINNKRIGKARLEIQNITTLKHNNGCHILFLTHTQISEITADMDNQSSLEKQNDYSLLFDENVLTMGDLSDKLKVKKKFQGVIINLIRRQTTRIGIEINTAVLNKSKIKLSSELLKISKKN